MAIAARLRHQVAVHRLVPGDETDARGDRLDSWEADDAIAGLVQRRSSRQQRGTELHGLGSVDGRAFLPIGTAVGPNDYLEHDGTLYEIAGPARDAGGRGRHLELDLHVVIP